ncbi:rhamnan synthesis F family protein [Lacibacter sp. H407]|uniref:rhamnan synthesis F family protein n=1 Tax=Lacibacter sp. H407 TaxID=3133423 RepID=UPI0030BBD86C
MSINFKPEILKATESKADFDIKFRNESNLTAQLCVFSSYSFTGEIDEYIYYYLQQLKKAGFSIAFVSTSKLSNKCINILSEYAFLIIERKNTCPDFGSWKIALEILNFPQNFDAILLANDSVFGPLYELPPIIKSMKKRFDIWGMTASLEIEYHLQSYFLYFSKKVIQSSHWKSFWQNIDTTLTKTQVIGLYEVGLSKHFLSANFSLGSYTDVEILSKSHRNGEKYLNPTLGFWRLLIERFEFPFLKREVLIKEDIDKIYWQRGLYVNTGNWKSIIKKNTNYPVEKIDSFLKEYYEVKKENNTDYILQKRKFLFLTHNIEIGGAQRVLLNFLKWLKTNTDIPFEIIVCREGRHDLLTEFSTFGNLTFFYSLSNIEKNSIKNRLISENISLIFSNTMVNGEAMKFLSFLEVPKIIFVHELSYVLNQFSSITDNLDWFRTEVEHFICCAESVQKNLINFLQLEPAKTSVINEFIDIQENDLQSDNTENLRKELNIPNDAFVIGMSGTFEWRKSADLLPIIGMSICNKAENIHIVWLGADKTCQLYNDISLEINKTNFKSKIHLIEKQHDSQPYFKLFNVFLMISREDPFPLVNLESGAMGTPVICFENTGGSEEYVKLGTGHSVPYLDIPSLVSKVMDYYQNPHLLKNERSKISSIVKQNFSTEILAPKVLNVISKEYDITELALIKEPSVTILTHIFFDHTWEEIKTSIRHFDRGNNHFLFSISEVCINKDAIISDIKRTFRNSYVIVTSNVGRDIGSKFALIELYLMLGINSSYLIFLHDKQSLHTLVGDSWKKNLFKILDPNNYRSIISLFETENAGIIGAKEHFINEYNPQTETFRHNNDLSKEYLKNYKIQINDYEYISGTIYWLKSSIIKDFFTTHNPINLRHELESGNVLDEKVSTKVHTWERMFCWITKNSGHTIKGI